jgi:hypothetical protein
MSVKGVTLKRLQDALRGRKLSGIAAYEINRLICGTRSYRSHVSQGDKLPGIHKQPVQAAVDRMIAEGVVAATSLLTPAQKAAIEKRRHA